jgi:hypothetical protein
LLPNYHGKCTDAYPYEVIGLISTGALPAGSAIIY